MNGEDKLTRHSVHANWDRYVQSPDQLAYSRFAKFPPDSGDQLNNVLGIEENERILEVGCGTGILAARLLATGRPEAIVGVEPNRTYLEYELPAELSMDLKPTPVRGDGFDLPFETSSFDRLLTHTLVNLLNATELEAFNHEVRRVLKPDGWISHMDGLGGDSWEPQDLRPGEDTRRRRQEFFDLLTQIHDDLETGFVNSVHDPRTIFDTEQTQPTAVDSFSSTLRVTNPTWSKQQRRTLLELESKANRDRISRLGKLLEARNELSPERTQLLEGCESDETGRTQSCREALEEGKELGWRSSTTLILTARLAG